MLNSNFKSMAANELSKQLKWYNSTMISLDSDPAINAIMFVHTIHLLATVRLSVRLNRFKS